MSTHHQSGNSGIKRAVQVLGTQAQLARSINVTKQAVTFWMNGSRTPSAETAIDIERATRGLVTVEDIRPDIDWKVVRGEAPCTNSP